jgi:hypothetical protein
MREVPEGSGEGWGSSAVCRDGTYGTLIYPRGEGAWADAALRVSFTRATRATLGRLLWPGASGVNALRELAA